MLINVMLIKENHVGLVTTRFDLKLLNYNFKNISSAYLDIVSFLVKTLGRNQDFHKGSVCGRFSLQNAWGERVFGSNLIFHISGWG